MTSFKTTKVADKILADSWKKVIIPVQHMFPNCQVKYKTKCTDMKTCDKEAMDKVAEKVKNWKDDKHFYFWRFLKEVKLEHKKPPKGFEGW